MSRLLGAGLMAGGGLLAFAALAFALDVTRSLLRSGIMHDPLGGVVLGLLALVAGVVILAGAGLLTAGLALYRRGGTRA